MKKLPTAKSTHFAQFNTFILEYRDRTGALRNRVFTDTQRSNVLNVARSFPAGTFWRIHDAV